MHPRRSQCRSFQGIRRSHLRAFKGGYPLAEYWVNPICSWDHTADTGYMSRDIVARFGRRIRQLRHAKGMNQTVLGEKAGTDQTTVSLIENGKQEPRLRLVNNLAGGLKVSLGELFKDL